MLPGLQPAISDVYYGRRLIDDRVAAMDDERARHFWERTLREIQDDGFFAPVQTAELPQPESLPPAISPRRRLTNVHLILIVVFVSLILAAVVLNWLAPALI